MNSRKYLLELLALREIDLFSTLAILAATILVVMAITWCIAVHQFVGMAVDSKPTNKVMFHMVGMALMKSATEFINQWKDGKETNRTHNSTHM